VVWAEWLVLVEWVAEWAVYRQALSSFYPYS